jgi:anti-sigma-K factor RskA
MTECGTDVAAYALGSLDDAERRSFERHLATCAVCPDELVVFEQVIAALAEVVPQRQAPPDLRRRVLAEARHAALSSTRSNARRSPTRRQLPAMRFRRPALALCALLVAAAAVANTMRPRSTPEPRTGVLQARVIGTAGSAEIRRTSGHAELIVHHLSLPPSGEIYEVWLNRAGRGSQPTTALFNVTGAGDADVDIPGDLRHVGQIMVTPEPAGGTRAPTHPAVITAQLT